MFDTHTGSAPETIGFVLVPGYSMMAFLSAVEPLRVANRLSGKTLFRWKAWTFDGRPAPASNGMVIDTLGALDPTPCPPALIVVAGFDFETAETKGNLGLLRRLARQGVALGALDTGPHLLAAAGLLDGHRACMHWEAVPGFREDFPDIAVSDELFEVSPGRFTCAGGTAALDMMLHMIGLKHGQKLAVAVSEQFIHDRIRDRSSHQRMRPGARLGVTSKRLLRIVEAMESHLETPLDAAALARMAGCSERQMERLFRAGLSDSPAAYYLKLRLDRARQLLRQTDLAVTEIAMATGFTSASSLSRSYRARFGHSPRRDRAEPR